MACLLGLTDAPITAKHTTDWQTNKIGGRPDWYANVDIKSPVCRLCGGKTSLVVQLYCPLEQSQYHRTLYIFACTKTACWNKNESWTVYRCQTLDSASLVPNTSISTEGDDDWGADAEDWGVQGKDDWGVAADDWGDEPQNAGASNKVPDITHSTNRKSNGNNNKQCEELPECLAINQMCIDDADTQEVEEGPDDEKASNVIADTVQVLTSEQRKAALQELQAEAAVDGRGTECGVELGAYFISVIEETCVESEVNAHVTRLLKDYQRREGCNLHEMLEHSGSGGGSGEKYEKTSVLHQDKIFHKFTKKLASCPQQIIRYEWSGQPLFISPLTSALPVSCGHCGSSLVFELQLTPALVNTLRSPHSQDVAVEFGTVLIFSCSESCWKEGDAYRQEQVIVQPDPDIQLYK